MTSLVPAIEALCHSVHFTDEIQTWLQTTSIFSQNAPGNGVRGKEEAVLTQSSQHMTELSTHDGAIALLVKDPQPLHKVLVGARVLILGDVLKHGQERFKVHHLRVKLCREMEPSPDFEG
jgi:hypothetical protein